MIVRGTWDWNLIKVETDSGLSGIGEAYWGWGVKDLVLNKLKPHHRRRGSAQRRQALYQNADAERRRGRHRRRHRDRRERHRDRALGSVRPHAADARVQPARRPVSRPRPLLPYAAGRRRTSKIMGAWRAQVQEASAEKWGWTAFKFQGDGVPVKADPQFQEPGHDPYARNLTHKDYRRIVKGMETVRETLGPDARFRHRVPTGGTTRRT